jgi:glycosyltransferase involved in cell wall biosynthesis
MTRQRPHILYVAEFSTGGSIESLLTLIGGLDKTEFELTVLFFRMPDASIRERVEQAGAAVLSIGPARPTETVTKPPTRLNMQSRLRRMLGSRIEYAYASVKYALQYVRFRLPIYRAIREQLRVIQPDLVHFNNTVIADTAGIHAARTCSIPAISHVRNFGEITYLSVAMARTVRVFVCISNAVRDYLVERGIDARRCVVIPNAVDLDRFSEKETVPTNIRKEFGWNSTDKVFAMVGRLVSWKGQEYFIRAIAKARAANSSIRGLIVGDDVETGESERYVARLKSLIDELNVGDAIRFTGHRTDVPNVMKAADVVICASSKPEPFGRVIIESMAVGTLVVATDAGGVTDIIDDGVNGILVPIRNSNAMAEAMLRVTNDTEFEQAIRAAGLRSVTDHYTVASHAASISDLYNRVLGHD